MLIAYASSKGSDDKRTISSQLWHTKQAWTIMKAWAKLLMKCPFLWLLCTWSHGIRFQVIKVFTCLKMKSTYIQKYNFKMQVLVFPFKQLDSCYFQLCLNNVFCYFFVRLFAFTYTQTALTLCIYESLSKFVKILVRLISYENRWCDHEFFFFTQYYWSYLIRLADKTEKYWCVNIFFIGLKPHFLAFLPVRR